MVDTTEADLPISPKSSNATLIKAFVLVSTAEFTYLIASISVRTFELSRMNKGHNGLLTHFSGGKIDIAFLVLKGINSPVVSR